MSALSRYLWLAVGRLPIVVIAVGLCFAAHGVLAEDQDSFIAGVEDLPLMPGLREIPAAGTVFDSAGGRIVEAYAVGDVDEDAVMAFYKDSLPQLGWTIVDQTMFRRSGEILKLEFARAATELTVHFSLSPE